jgi:hypothetical protein
VNLGMGAAGARTGLTAQPGTQNTSQNYYASLGLGALLTATGSYARSSGQALETGSGLVPVTGPIPPSSLVSLYGGNGYGLGLSSAPVKGLILSATYSKSTSNTSSDQISSSNQNEQFNALVQYQVRKLYFTSGYSRLVQGFSGSGSPPEVISSFYIGISRWFNFF